ncbi:hypothetical protein ACFVHS_25255 [Streptomyces sp. NPDC057746]|uniref:hypothetical protein n=1 Tax=Streptomyces sp. NPDC057746 TaxID=3346237 RepID=UPI0036BD7500
MTPGADERWVRRIMGGLGARPVGHTDLHDEPQPAVPVQPEPVSQARVPDWWRLSRPQLEELHEDPKATSDADPDKPEDADGDETQEEGERSAPPAAARGPVEKKPDGKKRSGIRARFDATDNRSMRIIAFNLSAAGVGYGIGLVPILEGFLPAAEDGAIGMFQLGSAVTAGFATWWVTGFPGVRTILPVQSVTRLLVTAGAAEVGRRLAPAPVAYLNEFGTRWGLGPDAISLLLTAGVMCGGLYWLIDRRTRGLNLLGRWLLRIPLASALLATALYAPGPVV